VPVNKEKRDNTENQVNFQSFLSLYILYINEFRSNNYSIQILNLFNFNNVIKIFILKICILNKYGYNSIE